MLTAITFLNLSIPMTVIIIFFISFAFFLFLLFIVITFYFVFAKRSNNLREQIAEINKNTTFETMVYENELEIASAKKLFHNLTKNIKK